MPQMPFCSDADALRWRHARVALWAVLLAGAIAWSFWGTIGKPDCQDMDFGAYYRAALAVRQSHTPYTVDEYGPMAVYPYAPAFAYGFIPLTYLEYPWACRGWLIVNWLATLACFFLAIKLLRLSGQEFEEIGDVILLALVPTSTYLWANLRVGQVSMIMVFGCLGWAYYQQRGQRILGGALLATASALKLAPLAFVPYLVIQRDWRGLAGFVAGGMLLFALPAGWVGWDGTWRLHHEWFQHTANTQVPVQIYRPGNQSLLAQLARLPPISNGHECFSPEHLTQLTHAYPSLLLGLGATLYAWILWGRRRHRDTVARIRGPDRDPLHVALLLIFLTLASPRAWRCNFVALALPCLMMAQVVCRRGTGSQLGLAALGLVLLACVVPTNGIGEQGWNLGVWLLQGKHFWAALALGGACWWTSRSPMLAGTARG